MSADIASDIIAQQVVQFHESYKNTTSQNIYELDLVVNGHPTFISDISNVSLTKLCITELSYQIDRRPNW